MSPHVIVRHMIDDFSSWKVVLDDHQNEAHKYGLKTIHILRDITHKNDITILLEAQDLERARAFMTSSLLQQAMEKAGVVSKPDIQYLSDAS